MMRFSDFVQWWRQAFANSFFQTVITKPSEGETTLDVVLMGGEDGQATQELTRLEQFGDVVIPPGKKNQCISIVSGAAGVTMSLADPETRPTDGKSGDRGLYSNQKGTRIHLYGAASAEPGAILITNPTGARAKILASGDIYVDAATDKNIVFNGGGKNVSRVDDFGSAGKWTVQHDTDGGGNLTVQMFYTEPDAPIATKVWEVVIPGATPQTPPDHDTNDVPLKNKMREGAPHVLA